LRIKEQETQLILHKHDYDDDDDDDNDDDNDVAIFEEVIKYKMCVIDLPYSICLKRFSFQEELSEV
jgi:hypothetical protein